MSNEKREQQMMTAADRYAAEVCDEFHTGAQVAETINDFCAGWRAADQHPQWIPVEEMKDYKGETCLCDVGKEYDLQIGWLCFEVSISVERRTR